MPEEVVAPEPQTEADKELERLAAERFAALMRRYPVFASFLGLHEHDARLGDASREAILADVEQTRRYQSALERMDPATLSPYHATERELALFVTRRDIFDSEVHRVWERRASATDEIGDGIFLLFARGGRPLAERLEAIAGRLEGGPQYLDESRTRFGERAPVRLWNETELEAVESLPSMFEEVAGAARNELGESHRTTRRIEKGIAATRTALDTYAAWLKEQIARGTDEFAMGAADYDTLVGLRAFDGLSADDILAIGNEALVSERAARQEVAKEIDPSLTEQEAVDRVKSDHAADFNGALTEYRTAMAEARQYIVDHDLATIPPAETLKVIETPQYMRGVIPFAAYFSPGKFEPGRPEGIYVVTPSVDGDPRAMREHNRASMYNTGIHEAYPGHHLQLVVANQHPSLTRVLVDAPEFVEGWGMYSELMMREQGFDTSPSHRLMMHTDAIWRACRIILDVKLQRGEIGVDQATDFLVEQTGFERPQAAAEIKWYTYRPTYPLSYLLGRQLLLRLRADEQKRLGPSFSLRAFHDALLNQGSLPISFQRRLLAQAE
ncbi:MAG TPA: DUF885 domain-containing protein [Candidatus Limnocylindria bacterium]|nr:DUF885 domain-containing protein [Candidatus Limnocylindria bacterium]